MELMSTNLAVATIVVLFLAVRVIKLERRIQKLEKDCEKWQPLKPN